MSIDESLEGRSKPASQSVSADAADWGTQFVKHLESEFVAAAAQLPNESTWADFRRAMLCAFISTLSESGAETIEISRMLREMSPFESRFDPSAEWTTECNARRVALIDKWIQGSLTNDEAVELEQLTARLRFHVDNEDLVPLEGARQLHGRLLELDSSSPRSG